MILLKINSFFKKGFYIGALIGLTTVFILQVILISRINWKDKAQEVTALNMKN